MVSFQITSDICLKEFGTTIDILPVERRYADHVFHFILALQSTDQNLCLLVQQLALFLVLSHDQDPLV